MKPTPPEPPLRDQLIAAEAAITEQLFRLRNPLAPIGVRYGGPPDNRSIIATLEAELEEIRAALANENQQD